MNITQHYLHFNDRKKRKNNTHFERINTAESIQEMRERQFIKRQLINSRGNICAICGKPITNMNDITIDHIIPLSKGGMTTLENCQLAHFECNQEKANDLPNL